jgi:hypothetical protein
MTPEQRYFFDTSGFLHLKNVLTGEALQKAQEAADRYVKTPPEDLPPGFKKGNGGASHGFAFDKVLEALVFHPVTWPIVKELTAKKPRLASGSFRFESVESTRFFELHSGREEWGPQTPRYFMHDGRLYCDYFVCFFYLTDVFPGDGATSSPAMAAWSWCPAPIRPTSSSPKTSSSLRTRTPTPNPIPRCSTSRRVPAMWSSCPS